jgi:hypothetical protein
MTPEVIEQAHDATSYTPDALYIRSPQETSDAVNAAIEDIRRDHKVDDISTVAQYRQLTGQTTPVPTVTTLTPNTKVINTGEFTVVVAGTNFQRWSQVIWNGDPRPTVYTSATSLTVTAPAVISAGVVPVKVSSGGAAVSNSVNFTFTAVVVDDVPDATWVKPDIVNWLADHGVTLSTSALNQLTKAELLELVQGVLSPDDN